MQDFFPILSNVNDLWINTGERERWGATKRVRNELQWHKLGVERDMARGVAIAWREAALKDGWTMKPTYQTVEMIICATLQLFSSPQGVFQAHIETRPNVLGGDEWRLGGGNVTIWGPDKLQIPAPQVYPGRAYFENALKTCPHCFKGPNSAYFGGVLSAPVATKGYSFAGRACEECAPQLREQFERPGWNN